MQHFWHIMLYYFKKGKSTTETHKKDLCSVWRRCCDWPDVSKVVREVMCWRSRAGDCTLDGAPRSGRPVESIGIKLRHYMFYHARDSRHTQNTQIGKVIGENEKYVFYAKN